MSESSNSSFSDQHIDQKSDSLLLLVDQSHWLNNGKSNNNNAEQTTPPMAISEKHVYKYRCSQCSLAFKTMKKLQLHSQYHLIRDATKCVLCGRRFRSIIALQKHVETSHADLSEEEMLIFKQSFLNNPFLLDGLNSQTIAEENYNDPNLTLHNKKVPHRKGEKVIYPMEKYLDPNRPYKCEVCKESFTQKNILLVHYNSVGHLHKLKRTSQPVANTTSAADETFMKCPLQTKKSSHMYKHLLENFGFDLVMQFNETHQRRQRKEREENERLSAELQSTQFLSEESTNSTSVEMKKENISTFVKEEREESSTQTPDELPEVSKSTCAHCNKEFSSVWVLKAHCEEVHKDLVPLDFLERYAQQIKCEIEKKVVPSNVAVCSTSSITESISSAVEVKKENSSTIVEEDREESSTQTPDELPEVSKSVCTHCNKELSNVWVLKAHCEEVHKDLVPLEFLEKYAQQIKCEIEKKIVPSNIVACSNSSSAESIPTTVEVKKENIPTVIDEEREESLAQTPDESFEVSKSVCIHCNREFSNLWELKAHCEETHKDLIPLDFLEKYAQQFKCEVEKKAVPSNVTTCSTPASSTESIPPTSTSSIGVTSNNASTSLSISLAQQMNELQVALSAMAASQLQLQQFNPMVMGMASLGMGLPLGLNMPTLAAMNLQPPLVPMMMPPPSFDPIVGLGQAQNSLFSQQNTNIDATSILTKQQQHLIQQQQVVSVFFFSIIFRLSYEDEITKNFSFI